jgi:hypothetical protein
MPAVKIQAFGGMLPAVDDRLLPETAAARSENAYLYSGALAGMPEPTLLRALTNPDATKVYRIPTDFTDADHLADATWIEHEHPDTDTIRTQVVGDTHERYYWASPAEAPMYNSLARIISADDPYILGIPAPSVAPVVVPAGGSSGINVTRSYVYTWVSVFGEEGPISPPTVVTGETDDTWAITLTAAAADDLDGPDRDLDNVRIYRTITAANGVASYFLVAEQVITDLTYDDVLTDTVVAANSALQSTLWIAPPTTLRGWVSMPNGVVAGFRENEIWFCEPYRLHAWPATYALAVDYPIVGLGVIGQSLIVCTQSYPFAITGVHPRSMTQAKIMNLEPCLSRGSILSSPEGVYYASSNGLVLVAGGVAQNITQKLITKDRWQQFVRPATLATLRAARLGSAYYAFGSNRTGVFQADTFQADMVQDEDFTGSRNGIIIDTQNERVAFSVLSQGADESRTMSQNDPWSGELFVIVDGDLYWINIADDEPTYETFIWKSKIFQAPEAGNWAVMKVYFETSSTTPTQNPVRVTTSPQTLASDQYGLIRVFADGELVNTREIRTSGELLRIASGFKATYMQFEIEARVKILSFQFATSAKALAKV